MTKTKSLKKQFEKSVNQFERVLKKKKTEFIRDSAIKRFELTFDIAWKLVKAVLEEEKGVSCFSPKDCFREAFRQKIIDPDPMWLRIVDLRNFSVHIYDEKFADDLYKRLPKILKMFKVLQKSLEKLEDLS